MDTATIAAIVAASTPLVFASVGETLTEKSGVVNLSLDGSILLSAMTGFAIAATTDSVVAGFVAAALVAMAVAMIVAVASIELRLNQIAVGFVLTLLAAELSTFLGRDYTRRPGPSVPQAGIPLLEDIPFFGEVFFDHNVVVYASFALIILSYLWIYQSRPGLELQAVGERPEAAFARGIPVNRLRYVYVALGGALVGIAGAAFSLDVKLGWSEGHTTNYGWIALAIVIFGGWHPFRVALGCYLFGLLQIAALKLQPELPNLSQVLPITPFPLMILALVIVNRPVIHRLAERWPLARGFVITEPPSALGTAFRRE